MSLLDIIFGKKKQSALVAKERLQIILAHERATINGEDTHKPPQWLPQLQQELVAVIAKYIKIDQDALSVHIEKRENMELLEINVTLPEQEEEVQ